MNLDHAISWRAKSIEEFNLIPVPDGWKDAVAVGTEEAWKRYYEYRNQIESDHTKRFVSDGSKIDDSDDDDDDDYYVQINDDDNYLREFMAEWKNGMVKEHIVRLQWCSSNATKSLEEARKLWPWTPTFGDVSWDENDFGEELVTGEYRSHVWSPFAIPHAIDLYHFYHRRPRYNTMEFKTYWKYHSVDFGDVNTIANKVDLDSCCNDAGYYKILCFNRFEDEKLRLDVIDAKNLTIKTVKKLRKFLYGTNRGDVVCDHHDFLRLLFASMGTIDSRCDPKCGWLGYEWMPDEELRNTFVEEQIPLYDAKFDPDGEPGKTGNDYYECGLSWLEYHIAKAADDLDPITIHYKPPRKEDAPGWYEGYDEDNRGLDEAAMYDMLSQMMHQCQRQR